MIRPDPYEVREIDPGDFFEGFLKICMILSVVACFVLIDQARKSPEANPAVARIAAGKR